MLDKGGAVKSFVDALQQLTNPDMIFKVIFTPQKKKKRNQNGCFCLGFCFNILCFCCFGQDWWESVKSEMEKSTFNKKQMGEMYEEMHSSLCNRNTQGHGGFRRKFIQVGSSCYCTSFLGYFTLLFNYQANRLQIIFIVLFRRIISTILCSELSKSFDAFPLRCISSPS